MAKPLVHIKIYIDCHTLPATVYHMISFLLLYTLWSSTMILYKFVTVYVSVYGLYILSWFILFITLLYCEIPMQYAYCLLFVVCSWSALNFCLEQYKSEHAIAMPHGERLKGATSPRILIRSFWNFENSLNMSIRPCVAKIRIYENLIFVFDKNNIFYPKIICLYTSRYFGLLSILFKSFSNSSKKKRPNLIF